LIKGQIDLTAFRNQAEQERQIRMQRAEERAAHEAVERAKLAEANAIAIKAHFAQLASDPKIRRIRRRGESKELRNRFGIGDVEREDFRQLIILLQQVSSGHRLNDDDVVWLSAHDYWTKSLRKAWHMLEAEACAQAWTSDRDPWHAVNASSHWRKADKPDRSLKIAEEAQLRAGLDSKVSSALATTRGGAMRDLRRFEDARDLGMEAHTLAPFEYRPCTLLGAVHLELGELEAGHQWYQKAENLGAKPLEIDQELRTILARMEPAKKNRLRAFLVRQDSERFASL
jgi:hypothetical protein